METKKKLPFSLFIFDLDGTALGGHEPYKQFPPEFAGFLDELASNGTMWATATTWSVDEQLKMIRSSGVKSDPVLLTGSSGRSAFTVSGNELHPVSKYEQEISRLEIGFLKKYEKTVQDIIKKLQAENLVEDISYNLCGHHVISFKAAKGKTNELWQILQPLLEKEAYYPFTPGNLENNSLLPEYMNKGRAVKLIQRMSGVSPDKTLIAGDETNDLHMFDPALAKFMVCPVNANSKIKKIVRDNHGIISEKIILMA